MTDEPIVPQRAVLVLPSNGAFDSRAYRIARTLVERGHTVTVLARLMGDFPAEETHLLGYRIVRVPASSVDGIPFQHLVRFGRAVVRRVYSWRTRTPYRPPEQLGATTASPTARQAAAGEGSAASLPRRAFAGLIRRLAIPLTLRSHTNNARRIAPGAEIYHGMAYMGIPIALDLARRHRGKAIYDARDIYLDARNLARMRGPARWLIARGERPAPP